MQLWPLLFLPVWLLAPQDHRTGLRMKMVREQIELRGVSNPDVLAAMREVPRHVFVPPAEAEHAYEDHPLPIGYGATISQPYIVGLMTELLDVKRSHQVLEIGTGSGYQAAILARLADEVYSMEIVPELAKSAASRLRELGYKNVAVLNGDGYRGWPDKAPFDRIILTAAPPEIPQALIDQLKPGGKLVAPVGDYDQNLFVVEKARDGQLKRRMVIPVRFVPMTKGKR